MLVTLIMTSLLMARAASFISDAATATTTPKRENESAELEAGMFDLLHFVRMEALLYCRLSKKY